MIILLIGMPLLTWLLIDIYRIFKSKSKYEVDIFPSSCFNSFYWFVSIFILIVAISHYNKQYFDLKYAPSVAKLEEIAEVRKQEVEKLQDFIEKKANQCDISIISNNLGFRQTNMLGSSASKLISKAVDECNKRLELSIQRMNIAKEESIKASDHLSKIRELNGNISAMKKNIFYGSIISWWVKDYKSDTTIINIKSDGLLND